MGWKNSLRDELPKHNEEVVISINGIYYFACYNGTENGFDVKGHEKLFFIKGDESAIYWQKLTEL